MPYNRRMAIKAVLGAVTSLAFGKYSLSGEQLTIAVPAAYPFSRMRAGMPEGLIAEAIATSLLELGQNTRYVQLSIPQIYQSVASGLVDGGMVMTDIGGENSNTLFTTPIIEEYSLLVTARGRNPDINSLDDLRGLRIGGRKGFVYESLDLPLRQALVLNSTDDTNIRDLLIGRLDVAIVGGIKVMHELRAQGVMRQLFNTELAVGKVALGAGLANSSSNQILLPKLNLAISHFLKSDQWTSLISKHAATRLVRDFRLL